MYGDFFAGGVLVVQYMLQRLEHAVRHKPAVREMLRSAYREVLILGLIAFVVFIFELAGSEEFDSEGSGVYISPLLCCCTSLRFLYTAPVLRSCAGIRTHPHFAVYCGCLLYFIYGRSDHGLAVHCADLACLGAPLRK